MKTIYQQTNDPGYLEANVDIKVREATKEADVEDATRRFAMATRGPPERR